MRKKGLGLFLGFTLLFTLVVFSSAAVVRVKVIVDNANIRLKPDLTSQIVAQVPLGTVLQSEGMKGEWYLVNITDERGYTVSGYVHQSIVEVMGETIRPVTPQPQPTPPPPQIQQPQPPPLPRPQAYAPPSVEVAPKSCVGVRGGFAMPSEANYGSGFIYGGSFCIGLNKYIAVELSGMRFQSTVDEDPEALSKGKLSVMPIQLSVQFRYPASPQFIPYVQGGAGYYLNSFTVDADVTEGWEDLGFTIEEEVKGSIGFHFGAGVDYFFTENIAFNVDFRYCIAKADGSWTMTDTATSTSATEDLTDLNLNTIMFGGGLKFCF